MGMSCTQLQMFYHFYVANKSRESETSAYSNLYAFVCYFIFQSAKNNTISSTNLHKVTILYIMTSCYLSLTYCSIAIYCNILQYAIYQYSLLAMLYCIAVVNIAIRISIYRYIVSPLAHIHTHTHTHTHTHALGPKRTWITMVQKFIS